MYQLLGYKLLCGFLFFTPGCLRSWSSGRRRRVTSAGWRRRSSWRRRNSTSFSSLELFSASWQRSLSREQISRWTNFRWEIDQLNWEIFIFIGFSHSSDGESVYKEEKHPLISEICRQLWSPREVSFQTWRFGGPSSLLQVRNVVVICDGKYPDSL